MENRDDVLTLKDEDGNEVEFEYLDTLTYNDKEFIVLLPLEQAEDDGEEEEEEGEIVILEVKESGDDTEEFLPVEDDDELEAVFKEFKERMKDEFEFADEDEDDN